MDSMIARTNDYVGGLVLANLTNIIDNLGFVKSVRFLAEEVDYALNVTRQNLTGISFNFLVPNQVMQGSVKLNLKEESFYNFLCVCIHYDSMTRLRRTGSIK